MADVIGPNSYLPGQKLKCPTGMTCDCCNAVATVRVVGETDSFGSEIEDYCQTCWGRMEAESAKAKEEDPEVGYFICDRCRRRAECEPTRDLTEGRCGPLYYYCKPCMGAHRDAMRREFDDGDDDYYED